MGCLRSASTTPLDRGGQPIEMARWPAIGGPTKKSCPTHRGTTEPLCRRLIFFGSTSRSLRMLCARLSRPSLLLVAAGILAPSRGIDVCAGVPFVLILQRSLHECGTILIFSLTGRRPVGLTARREAIRTSHGWRVACVNPALCVCVNCSSIAPLTVRQRSIGMRCATTAADCTCYKEASLGFL